MSEGGIITLIIYTVTMAGSLVGIYIRLRDKNTDDKAELKKDIGLLREEIVVLKTEVDMERKTNERIERLLERLENKFDKLSEDLHKLALSKSNN